MNPTESKSISTTEYPLLSTVRSPTDVKKMSAGQLEQLSSEIREILKVTTSKNSGHLSPNLGVVELTIAIHRAFNSPKDKILFDTGHQSYVHKLLTGRFPQFHTIRLEGGLSGFSNPSESKHDHFITGHCGPSISQAVGLATAQELKGEKGSVIAVIGDGALTSGLALEGLNYAGYKKSRIIIVINDNQMSYNKTVGGIQAYNNRLSMGNRMFDTPIYHQVRGDIHLLLDNLAHSNTDTQELNAAVKRLREAALSVMTPGILFEEMGYTYFGPLDGHNIELLTDTFRKAAMIHGPVIVHVITKKGKGCYFAQAEQDDNGKYHANKGFDIKTGEIPKKVGAMPSYSSIFGDKVSSLAREHSDVVAMTAAMTLGTGLVNYSKEFPDRFYDVGIAEQHAVTMAAGLAKGGMKPFAAIYSSFLKRALDPVIFEVALQKLPVTFVMDRAGLVDDNPTQQGPYDLAYLRIVPNLVSMAPANEHEIRSMMDFAYEYRTGPTSIRLAKDSASGMPEPENNKIKLGTGEIVVENGSDVAIFAIGSMVDKAITAADQLKSKGIMATVVNGRFIKPLDEKLLKGIASKCGHVVTVEEGIAIGGFGSGINELMTTTGNSDVKFRILGIPDRFIEHGLRKDMLKQLGLSPEGITSTAEELVNVRV